MDAELLDKELFPPRAFHFETSQRALHRTKYIRNSLSFAMQLVASRLLQRVLPSPLDIIFLSLLIILLISLAINVYKRSRSDADSLTLMDMLQSVPREIRTAPILPCTALLSLMLYLWKHELYTVLILLAFLFVSYRFAFFSQAISRQS